MMCHPSPVLPLLNVGTSMQVVRKPINELTAEEVDVVLLPEVSLGVFLPHIRAATSARMDEDCRTAQSLVSPLRGYRRIQSLYSDTTQT